MLDFSKLLRKSDKKQLYILGGLVVFFIIFVVAVSVKLMKPTPPPPLPEPEIKEPVYEITLGDIHFKLEEAKDRGDILEASEVKRRISNPKSVTTTEKYIEVIVGASNIGKETIKNGKWNLGELIDSQGRVFSHSREFLAWTPVDNNCGVELRPGFSPSSCMMIYEVAQVATGLQVRIKSDFGQGLIDLGI